MKIAFAEKCQWRAMYVRFGDRQVFHIGVDPNYGVKPTLFGGFGIGSWNSWIKPHGFNFRLPLPWMAWNGSENRVRMFFYNLFTRFWHSVDGRF